MARYRDLLDFPARFLAGVCGFDARAAFRAGFLAAAFAVLAVGLEALRALIDFALGFVDLVVEVLFFGVVFAFRIVRFLAALIAAPESRCRRLARPVLSRPPRQQPPRLRCFQPCL